MATTVQELINYLGEIEDKEQAIIYQYYTYEHFSTDRDTFEKVADEFDSMLPADSYAIIEAIQDFTPEEY